MNHMTDTLTDTMLNKDTLRDVMLAPTGNALMRDDVEALQATGKYRGEVKFDGNRLTVLIVQGKVVSMQPRPRKDKPAEDVRVRFPEVVAAIEQQAAHFPETVSITLDGEVGFLDATGVKMDFGIIQKRPRTNKFDITAHALKYPFTFVAFDVLEHNGVDLRALPWEHRRSVLEANVLTTERVKVSAIHDDMVALYDHVVSLGGEGIMVKTKGHIYHAGKRSPDWRKAKAPTYLDSLHVVGLLEGTGKRDGTFGSFILARKEPDGSLTYVCEAGSGLRDDELALVTKLVPHLARPECPLKEKPALRKPLLAWLDEGIEADIKYEQPVAQAPRFPRVVNLRLPRVPGVTA